MTAIQGEKSEARQPDDDYLGIEVPIVQPFRSGPDTWNRFYYAVLIISVLVGLLALLRSGSVVNALLYFFVSLMGTALLSVAFLSFVIAPLYIKHQQRVVDAKKAAILARKAVAIEKLERRKAERYQTMVDHLQDEVLPIRQGQKGSSQADVHKDATMDSSEDMSNVEDQAASLRRMVAKVPESSL